MSLSSVAVLFAAVFLLSFISPPDALSVPMFSRQIGRDCTFCHRLFPKLNETGRTFRANGYRLAGEGEWRDVRDWETIPASFEIEVEGAYDRVKSGGIRTESSDLKIEEAELFAGGAMGKTGKVTAFGIIKFEQTDTGSETKTSIHRAFVQINDLAGPAGTGVLNLRAGQWDIGLPFLNPVGAVISNGYLAESKLNILTSEQRAIEANGSSSCGEESSLTHRYSIGVSREDINGDNKLKGYYAAYSISLSEKYNLGAIYRGGKENDISYNKYGAAAEAEAGPFTFTIGYFRSDRSGAADLTDYLAEVLYMPLPKVSFGARYDALKEKGMKGAKSQSIMARYNILSNVFTQIEFRRLSDDDLAAGVNEKEDKARVILMAIF
ncbi:MAG: hypothetical protein Q7T24_06065 [Deltaproteobacteria bacterium]|nr:hypothetical protein [Deltaproteobacteria bacterium]